VGGNALYFHIGETETKCFIEEIPEDTLLVGKYKVEIFDKGQNKFVPTVSGLGMHVEIKDPDRKMVLSRTYSDQGQFSFTSHTSGEHTICLHSNSSAWFNSGQLRVHLDIQVGEHAQDYYAIAAKDKLTDLELRVRQLLDQVEQISKEQNYQRVSAFDEVSFPSERNNEVNELSTGCRFAVQRTRRLVSSTCRAWLHREEVFRHISESTNQRVLWWSILQTVILLGTGFWQMRHLKSFFQAKKLV
uniref:GOLD domain-containing protein n=1 Tax=Macrostomum lignano TaxID=282301 RepID=A0A1I8I6E7_9PLAT